MPEDTLFAGWTAILRTLAIGVPAYVFLVIALRISGKRSLSRMNAFDLVVTVSLGSTLATMLLSKTTSLSEGATALALLIALQFMITWLSVRSVAVRRLVRADPALLFHGSEFIDRTMKRERVSRDEVLQAVRSSGLQGMSAVGSVVLETDGTFSVLPSSEGEPEELLSNMHSRKADDALG